MSVQEIKAVISKMSPGDLAYLAHWFEEFQRDTVMQHLTQDSKVSQLDLQPRIAGLHAGTAWISDDFDLPLPEEFWTGAA